MKLLSNEDEECEQMLIFLHNIWANNSKSILQLLQFLSIKHFFHTLHVT